MYKMSTEFGDLRQLFWQLLTIGLFTDCTLVGSCGQGMNLHKIVLLSSSELLAVSKTILE